MGDDKPKRLECPICGAKRWTIEQMKAHMLKKHIKDKK